MALTKLNNQSLSAVTSAGLPTLASANMPSGTVLQVKQATGTTVAQPSVDNTFVDCTAAVTITPSSSNSKILLMHTAGGILANVGNASIRLLRDSTIVMTSIRHGYKDSNSNYSAMNWANQYLDSPSTTSAVTYKWQIAKQTGPSAGLRHTDTATAVSIAMEIAG